MRDRQYLSSLAVFVAGALLALAGILSLPLWLGWLGLAGLVMIGGGLLLWFYWGPRPDLPAGGRADMGDQRQDE